MQLDVDTTSTHTLNNKAMSEPYSAYNADPDILVGCRQAVDYVLIPELAEYARFISASDGQRRIRAETFFNPPVMARSRLGQGLHDRGEASIFAQYALDADDREALAVHLPLHLKTIRVAHKRVDAGETWDVSVRGDAWGLDDMEELYVVLQVGTLELAPDARVVVRGNVFIMVCDELIVHEARADYQIGILPTPHSVDFGQGPHHGLPGAAGEHGAAGRDGRPLDTVETFIGPRSREPVVPQLLCGAPGGAGEAGARGGRGRNGGMCKLADIVIRKLTGSMAIFAQAGAGGDGGDGGTGGDGGDGGHGVPGPWLVGGKVADGAGGAGGVGGAGGDGGAAGSGGIASNIYLTLPAEAAARVECRSLPSQPGEAGKGGAGGRGGRAGRPNPGEHAIGGRAGCQGPRGRGRAAPWIFVNELPVAGTGVPRPAAQSTVNQEEESSHDRV